MALPEALQKTQASQNFGEIPYDSDTTKGGKNSDGTYMFRVLDMAIVTTKGIQRVFLNKQVVAVLEEGSKLREGEVVKESASAQMGDYYFTRLQEMASALHGFHGADEINENMTCPDKDWYTPLMVANNTVGRDSVFSQRIVTGPHMVKDPRTDEMVAKIDKKTGEDKMLTKRFYKGVHTKAEVLAANPDAAKYFPNGFREDQGLPPHEPLVVSHAPVTPTAPATPSAPAEPSTVTAPPAPPEAPQ